MVQQRPSLSQLLSNPIILEMVEGGGMTDEAIRQILGSLMNPKPPQKRIEGSTPPSETRRELPR